MDFLYFILATLIISFIGLIGVFKKANKPLLSVFIPIINVLIFLRIIGRPWWWFILYLIPGINVLYFYYSCDLLAQKFGKSQGFSFGLFFLLPLFMLIIGFDNSDYEGYNSISDYNFDNNLPADLEKSYVKEENQYTKKVNNIAQMAWHGKSSSIPLIDAVNNENYHLVLELLSNGADVNEQDMLEFTPLMYAIQKKNKEIIKLLIKHNANVNYITSSGYSVLDLAESADIRLMLVKQNEFDSLNEKNLDLKDFFIDKRDNKKYKIVKIGNQIWMAENLAYKSSEGCWAYDNDESNVAEYGYLYNWETANNVCPEGWKLPTENDFRTLLNSIGGDKKVAYKALIKGGSSGFSALLSGNRDSQNDNYYGKDYSTFFWSSTNISEYTALDLFVSRDSKSADLYDNNKNGGYCVRCIKYD